VGTSVLEEGIDVPKCNLVIHFNVPHSYRSYVQSKGRARAQDAYYVLMIEEDRTEHFVNELAQYFEIEQVGGISQLVESRSGKYVGTLFLLFRHISG
jgi:endoribonuclease Dicer